MSEEKETCARCGKSIEGEETPFDDDVCERCVEMMLMPSSKDMNWDHWDFEKAEYKK